MTTIGDLIRGHREAVHLSQSKLAARAGYAEKALYVRTKSGKIGGTKRVARRCLRQTNWCRAVLSTPPARFPRIRRRTWAVYPPSMFPVTSSAISASVAMIGAGQGSLSVASKGTSAWNVSASGRDRCTSDAPKINSQRESNTSIESRSIGVARIAATTPIRRHFTLTIFPEQARFAELLKCATTRAWRNSKRRSRSVKWSVRIVMRYEPLNVGALTGRIEAA